MDAADSGNVTVRYAFVLRCRSCNAEISVGPTKDFTEHPAEKVVTGYYAESGGGYRLVGISEDGAGDSFECLQCHVIRWKCEAQQRPASRPYKWEDDYEYYG